MPVTPRQHGGDQEEARRNRRKHHTKSVKEYTSWKGPKQPGVCARAGGCLEARDLEAKNQSGLKTTTDKWLLPVALQASSSLLSHCLHLLSGKRQSDQTPHPVPCLHLPHQLLTPPPIFTYIHITYTLTYLLLDDQNELNLIELPL